ncbi:TlpA disulfide reductase family protein [uncultured Aquimarina sp.]|uniref:TlpA family protein disulfide reductase n=1 Tax=uncultured Aquimarina sp. TaxID=575652 RepID=UPI00261631B6|nr:TlpA disulfide reductase family protein [uncultured Aquimarina sp.]
MNKFYGILFICISFISCQKESPIDYAIFSGQIKHSKKIDTLIVVGDRLKKSVPIASDGSFSDTIPIDTINYFHFNLGRKTVELYLEKGNKLYLNADQENKMKTFYYEGEGANENNFLVTKNRVIQSLKDSINFFQYYNKPVQVKEQSLVLKNAIQNILDRTTTITPKFKEKELRSNQWNYLAELHKYVRFVLNDSLPNNYFEGLDVSDLSDASRYETIGSYKSLVKEHYNRKLEQIKRNYYSKEIFENVGFKSFSEVLKEIPDGLIKDDFMYYHSGLLLYPGETNETIENIFPLLMTSSNPNHKKIYQNKYERLKQLEKGKPSPSFEYEHYNGKMVSLSDFKGNYIYIDIWATWCKPCIHQFPYLDEFKREYKNKKIKFVGISIDEPKNKSKWKNLIKKKNLENSIQLYAGNVTKSDFMREYFLVTDTYSYSIPRFILIDPDGKIVDRNAPAPAETEKMEKLFATLNL